MKTNTLLSQIVIINSQVPTQINRFLIVKELSSTFKALLFSEEDGYSIDLSFSVKHLFETKFLTAKPTGC